VGLALLGGFHLPLRVGWRELSVGGLIAAIGFSIGLFFCAELFPPGQLRSETSMGVLLTLVAAPLAIIAAKILGVGRFSAMMANGAATRVRSTPILVSER